MQEFIDNNIWNNIGTEYLHTTENKAILFQQRTNENGEMYLVGTQKEIKDMLLVAIIRRRSRG